MKNWRIFLWSITVALGGFLFGFDTAVISGAELAIQKLWNLSDISHGLAIAMALYGTVIGALLGGIPADRFGRKKTLVWIGILYLISAVGSALAPEIYSFMFFRFIGGLGVGASSVVAPMYISEIAPAKSRGTLVALFQFNIVFGILIAYVNNYFMAGIGENAWRWMLGVEGIPAFLFSVLVLLVPRSPRWLAINQNEENEAREVLELIDKDSADKEMESIKMYMNQTERNISIRLFFSKLFRIPIILAVLFAFFNQLSGINAIIYYAPRIFKLTGVATENALLSASLLGLFNLGFTMLGIFLIDRVGRKTLMYIGSIGLIITLGLVANAFFSAPIDPSTIDDLDAYLANLSGAERETLYAAFENVLYYLCIYISFFAMSQGAVIWVFISEIFPNEVRGYGQSLGSFTHWILAAIITNIFPYFLGKLGGGTIFAIFCAMMILQLIYVWRLMPETKGKSLEELGLSINASSRETSRITQ